jgi:glycosyltransferase involved in cell wall biosynthesis
MLEGAAKQAAFGRARAFILPSHQENFGQVVAEALSAGTPVLISDKVNIWREVRGAGAGLVAPDTVAGTTQMLRDFLSLAHSDEAKLRAATRPCYDKHFSVPAAASDLEAVLLDAARSRLRPNSAWSAISTGNG